MKQCKKCHKLLDESEFSPLKKSKDRLTYHCKECNRVSSGMRHAKNRKYNNTVVKNLVGEIWKSVDEFNGDFQISNMGRIKSMMLVKNGKYSTGEKLLKTAILEDGYAKVAINRSGKIKKRSIHRLMALAFIPNPDNLPEVNHINTIKNDNRLENFEWITKLGNMQHANMMGRIKKYTHHKITEDTAREIKIKLRDGTSVKEIVNYYNMPVSTVYGIKYNKRWGWVTL